MVRQGELHKATTSTGSAILSNHAALDGSASLTRLGTRTRRERGCEREALTNLVRLAASLLEGGNGIARQYRPPAKVNTTSLNLSQYNVVECSNVRNTIKAKERTF